MCGNGSPVRRFHNETSKKNYARGVDKKESSQYYIDSNNGVVDV
jgi:hypothetical protein